ncbi:hypothetical protein K438DRAFT_1857377 [Mycena galopus ATCC 62051]|nr:hypothetical protein K438DRAFT_1857377 [Mycena galopus ATCC 62051]
MTCRFASGHPHLCTSFCSLASGEFGTERDTDSGNRSSDVLGTPSSSRLADEEPPHRDCAEHKSLIE